VAPRLAGLNAVYLGEQLGHYANGSRVFPLMQAMARPLSAQDVADLAVYIHGLSAPGAGPPLVDEAALARGRALYARGVPGRVPSCAVCHGATGGGKAGRSPEIAGEPLPYLETQLRVMRDHGRNGTLPAEAMTEEAHKLSDGDIASVAAYVATLEPVDVRTAK
jgi:cytochrome c553